jgi:hypothetical protein
MQGNQESIKLKVIAKIDCIHLAALKYIIDDYNKNNNNKLIVTYTHLFETDFNMYRDNLIRKHIEPSLIESPIIYLEVK